MNDIQRNYRRVYRGDAEMDVNSASMTDDRFLDHSRLGMHEEWQPSMDPKKPGKVGKAPISLGDNIERSMGDLKSRSVFKNECDGQLGPNGPGNDAKHGKGVKAVGGSSGGK